MAPAPPVGWAKHRRAIDAGGVAAPGLRGGEVRQHPGGRRDRRGRRRGRLGRRARAHAHPRAAGDLLDHHLPALRDVARAHIQGPADARHVRLHLPRRVPPIHGGAPRRPLPPARAPRPRSTKLLTARAEGEYGQVQNTLLSQEVGDLRAAAKAAKAPLFQDDSAQLRTKARPAPGLTRAGCGREVLTRGTRGRRWRGRRRRRRRCLWRTRRCAAPRATRRRKRVAWPRAWRRSTAAPARRARALRWRRQRRGSGSCFCWRTS
jgi:hypothetical protein